MHCSDIEGKNNHNDFPCYSSFGVHSHKSWRNFYFISCWMLFNDELSLPTFIGRHFRQKSLFATYIPTNYMSRIQILLNISVKSNSEHRGKQKTEIIWWGFQKCSPMLVRESAPRTTPPLSVTPMMVVPIECGPFVAVFSKG